MVAKIKSFFILTKIIINIFQFNFIHHTLDWNSFHNILHKSHMHMPTYPGLLSINVTSLSNIFCDM